MLRLFAHTVLLGAIIIGLVTGCRQERVQEPEIDSVCIEWNDQAVDRASNRVLDPDSIRTIAIPKLERVMQRCPDYRPAHWNAMAYLLTIGEAASARSIAKDWKERTGDSELLEAYEYGRRHAGTNGIHDQ